jgi:SAM-dependent methyltransferase
LISLAAFPNAAAKAMAKTQGNFRKVYLNRDLRNQFYNFLKNVFHLVPEDEMHELLTTTAKQNESDRAIYLQAQSQLGEITPYFSVLTYQLPSLWKQKEEMAKQTVGLLGEGTAYKGYLEIGSSGRYLDYLEEHCDIEGQRYYSDGKEPGYAISEMIDRGQIAIGAKYIPMADYRTEYSRVIGMEKLELITVYIGFHHCPLELRTRFISSVRDTLKPGGKLVLRDHDCHDDDQRTIVALAHDVFNLGTKESWEYNQQEIRNFYTLDFIIQFVENIGFRFEGQTLFQEGDPTRNALMLFTKI